jgi:uroporphyrinogen decarboxylase
MKEHMIPRERFNAVVSHRQVDRVVYDLCGCPQTLIDYQETRDALGALLGFTGAPQGGTSMDERFFGFTGIPQDGFPLDERILEYLDIDTRIVGGMPTPKTVHKRIEGDIRYDSYGIGYRSINGHYEICHNPLKGCTIDEMLAYPLPKAADLDRALIKKWAEQAQFLHDNTTYAIVAEHPVFGVFEIGCYLFGFDDYLYRLAAEPELVHAFSRRILAYQKEVIDIYYGALGRYIDCTTGGEDYGTQIGTFMSPEMFKDLIVPYLMERIVHTRKYTDAFYQHHSCGSIHSLIPILIDCGVDILNPIQPGAYMMEPERLKREYGDRITFWGGIDTQELLPRGSPEEVREAVFRILSIMEGQGGYILSPAHCIQQDVPAENIAAVYTGAKAYYG